jgi:chromosome segregation ATPase
MTIRFQNERSSL